MPTEIPTLHLAIASGVAFYLVVGRMFWDSFRELFYETIGFLIPTVIFTLIFEEADGSDGRGKIFLLLAGSIAMGVYVYFQLP